jgi:hypothetical protein
MRTVSDILMELRRAVEGGHNQAIPGLVLELGPNVLIFTQLPDEVVEDLLGFVASERFRAMEDSWRLLYFIDDNWDLLGSRHRERLRPVLEEAFDGFQSFMGAFVIGEILGRRYADDAALRVLDRLADGAALPARALVPHGLETLARATDDKRLREQAIGRLRELAASPTHEVREEATDSLRKVAADRR